VGPRREGRKGNPERRVKAAWIGPFENDVYGWPNANSADILKRLRRNVFTRKTVREKERGINLEGADDV